MYFVPEFKVYSKYTNLWYSNKKFLFYLCFSVRRDKVTSNVLQLGEVADLEALNFNLALMFI